MADGRGDDPLEVDVEEIGLSAEAEQDLRTIRSVRERIGEHGWGRLTFWDRLGRKLLCLYAGVPLLIVVTVLGELHSDIHLLVFVRKSPAQWEAGDWVYAGAWAAAVLAALLAAVGRLATGATLRRTAGQVKPPDIETEQVLYFVEGAAFFEEARGWERQEEKDERERQQEGAVEARLKEALRRGPAWWRVEVSGAHLLWWVALGFVLSGTYLGWPGGAAVSASWGALVSAIMFKGLAGGVGYFVVAHSPETKLAVLRYYRWWGQGMWPIVVVLVFAFFGAGAAES